MLSLKSLPYDGVGDKTERPQQTVTEFVAIVGRKLSLKLYRFSIQIKQIHDTPEIRLLGTDAYFKMFILTA